MKPEDERDLLRMETDNQSKPVMYPGTVIQILDLHNFWMQIGSDESLDYFHQLESEIQEFCTNNWSFVTNLDELATGQLVLVDSEEDEMRYRRGQLARVSSSDTADIFYVDYGSTGQMTRDRICASYPPHFQESPPQAIRCCLAGLKPIGKSWTSRGIKTFQALTDKKVFQTLIQYLDGGCYVVSLYSNVDSGSRSLTYQLLDEDVAMPYEENLAPEFEADIPAYLATFCTYEEDGPQAGYPEDTKDSLPQEMSYSGQDHSLSVSPDRPAKSSVQKSPKTPETTSTFQDFYPFDTIPTYPSSPKIDTSSQNQSVRPPPGFQGKPNDAVSDSGSDRGLDKSELSRSSCSAEKNSQSSLGDDRSPSLSKFQKTNFSNSNGHQHTNAELMLPVFYTSQSATYQSPRQPLDSCGTKLTPPTYYQPGSNDNVLPSYSEMTLAPPQYYQNAPPPGPNSQPSPPQKASPDKYQYSPTKNYQQQYNSYPTQSSPPKAYPNIPGYNQNHVYGTSPEKLFPGSKNSKDHQGPNYTQSGGRNQQLKVQISPSGQQKAAYYDTYHGHKTSPISPESPAISAFDINYFDHTQHVSSSGLTAKTQQERMIALKEEAEELVMEQAEEMVKHGMVPDSHDYASNASPAIFDQIADEIRTALKEPNEPNRLNSGNWRSRSQTGRPDKVSEVPDTYLSDIDFVTSINEALESAKTESMENTKTLLSEIVESMLTANVVTQLKDVVVLLLARGVQEYNLYYMVILDTLKQMADGGMNIKGSLGKALKKQQELCIRIPPSDKNLHLDCARMMGHIYKLSTGWSDSNAAIQDGILMTVEKWIFFNNKGTQIGQHEKESVFLDCFDAFWEVSYPVLHQHNAQFCSRIQKDVRDKLLNEQVSRCIKERLLEILLSKFSKRADAREEGTQTFQSDDKPAMCDQETMTEETYSHCSDYMEEVEEDGEEDETWYISKNNHGARSESMGYNKPRRDCHSTPQGSSKPYIERGMTVETSERSLYSGNSQYIENPSNNASSCYFTPDGSFIYDETQDSPSEDISHHNASQNPKSNGNSTHKPQKDNQESPADSISKNPSQNFLSGSSVANFGKVEKDKPKSIVDWFDYEPEPKNEKGKTSKSKNKTYGVSIQQIAEDLVKKSVPLKADKITANQSGDHVIESKQKRTRKGHSSGKVVKSVGSQEKSENIDWWSMGDNEQVTNPGRGGCPLNGDRTDLRKSEQRSAQTVVTTTTDHNTVEEIDANASNLEFGVDEDQFQFEVDDDDNWETDSDTEDDLHVVIDSSKLSHPDEKISYDDEFPVSDLSKVVRAQQVETTNDAQYNQDFPRTDLPDIVSQPKPVQQPTKRWVPGQWKCTVCGSPDHQVYQCPKSAKNSVLF